MTCKHCESLNIVKNGKTAAGTPRFKCKDCFKVFSLDQPEGPLGSMTLPFDKAVQIVSLLVEGVSIRSTERVTGVHRDTILRLLIVVGQKCRSIMDLRMRRLDCRLIQADEIWTYCFKKDKRVTWRDSRTYGDQYVFVAIDPETKLVPSFVVGKRTTRTTYRFIRDLAKRLRDRTQLSTDGFGSYLPAIEDTFGADIDFGQIIKVYHGEVDPGRERYSPGGFISMTKNVITGAPAEDLICTSHVERQNLTMRMSMRRFTRLTNAFSKKLENLKAAVALHFCWYNFVRIHTTLRVTPAMEAKLTDHVWTVREMLEAA